MTKSKIVRNLSEKIILLNKMQPCDVGFITNKTSSYYGDLVMRTASTIHFEVMNLTRLKEDCCWTSNNNNIQIQLLNQNEEINLILKGE